MLSIDDRHRRLGCSHKRVGERHPRRAGPDDQVVNLDDRFHRAAPGLPDCMIGNTG
jgi:hypothetical protein